MFFSVIFLHMNTALLILVMIHLSFAIFVLVSVLRSCFWQEIQHTEDFLIKPAQHGKKLDTSEWPLLLKVLEISFLFNLAYFINLM